MSRPLVIGLYAAAMGSGKSEVAKAILDQTPGQVMKFAGPLKDMTRALLAHINVSNYDIERYIEGDLKEQPIPGFEDIGLTPRRIMQTIGTEWRNLHAQDLWTRITHDKILALLDAGLSVIVDDLRFPHEYAALAKFGGVTVRIVRPGQRAVNEHASEGQLNSHWFDWVLTNDGTLEDLRGDVREMMEAFCEVR